MSRTNHSYDEDADYATARKIVRAKRKFRNAIIVFVTLMPVLIFINLWTSPRYLWFWWCALGLGISVVTAYIQAYVRPRMFGDESDEVAREMENLRRRRDMEGGLELRDLDRSTQRDTRRYDEDDFV